MHKNSKKQCLKTFMIELFLMRYEKSRNNIKNYKKSRRKIYCRFVLDFTKKS